MSMFALSSVTHSKLNMPGSANGVSQMNPQLNPQPSRSLSRSHQLVKIPLQCIFEGGCANALID